MLAVISGCNAEPAPPVAAITKKWPIIPFAMVFLAKKPQCAIKAQGRPASFQSAREKTRS